MLTISIAIVGISEIKILRNELASGGSTPIKSKTNSSLFCFKIFISVFSEKDRRENISGSSE